MIRSSVAIISTGRTLNPVSSHTSRATPSAVVSPTSNTPPGSDHAPSIGSRPRRISKTSALRTTTAATPTMGAEGYSRPALILDPSCVTSAACQTLHRTPYAPSQSVHRKTCRSHSHVPPPAAPPPNNSTATAAPHEPCPAQNPPSEPCRTPSPRPLAAYA